jgi:hypothetical protein
LKKIQGFNLLKPQGFRNAAAFLCEPWPGGVRGFVFLIKTWKIVKTSKTRTPSASLAKESVKTHEGKRKRKLRLKRAI